MSTLVIDLKRGGRVTLCCSDRGQDRNEWNGNRLSAFEVGFPPRSWLKPLSPFLANLCPRGSSYVYVPLRLVAACIKASGGFANEQDAERLPLLDIHIAECLAQDWMFFSSRAEGV